jgi:hypothetical protein
MDQKQFDLFATGIQWVKDEAERDYTAQVRHNQGTWGLGRIREGIRRLRKNTVQQYFTPVCPSACCLAGNIVLANGDEMVLPAEMAAGRDTSHVDYCMDAEGEVYHIRERATQVAGLTISESAWLFDACRTAESQIKHAQVIADRYGFTLDLA